MTFSEWSTIINTVIGLIGVIVAMVGLKCLSTAIKIQNSVKDIHDSTIQQAQIINNGMDSYAVIKITKETTQEELSKIVNAISTHENKLSEIQTNLDAQPKIYHIKEGEPIPDGKDGDIYFQYKE